MGETVIKSFADRYSRTCAQNVALPSNFETFCLQRSMDLEVIPLWIEKINGPSRLAHVFLVHNFDAGFLQVGYSGCKILFGQLQSGGSPSPQKDQALSKAR